MERIYSSWCISLALLKLYTLIAANDNDNLGAWEFNMQEPGLWIHNVAFHIHFEYEFVKAKSVQ